MSTKPDLINQEFDLWLTSGSTTIPLQMCRVGYSNGNQVAIRDPLNFQRNPVRQSSLKMYNSQQKYSDLEPPWTPIAQLDWSGGKGSKDFDNDNSMYFDGYQVDTRRPGEIILGGKPTIVSFGSLAIMHNTAGPNSYSEACIAVGEVSGITRYRRTFHTASETITVKDVTVSLQLSGINGATAGTLSLGLLPYEGEEVFSDNSITVSSITSVSTQYKFTFAAGVEITDTEVFALTFKATGLTTNSSGVLIYALNNTDSPGSAVVWTSDNGVTYTGTYGYRPYYYATNGGSKKNKARLFEYKGALYYAMQNNDATSTKLYLNGDHGLAKTGASTTAVTIKSGVTWAADEAIGSILVIVSGTGSNQPQNWRVITDNAATSSSETALTFTDPWDIAPAENDVLAIIASNKFTEVSAFDTNYNVTVTDVLSANGVVYFACGDSATLIRMVAYSNAGTWTYHWSDHTSDSYTAGKAAETGAFTHLLYGADQYGTYIFGAKGGYPATVAKAPVVDYTGYTGTLEDLLVFDTAQPVGDQWERITGLERYGESYTGALVAFKEGTLYKYREGYWEQIDIREMQNTKDRRNGLAHTVKGVYMYFSWHGTVLRYYNGILDRIGPDRAEVAIPTENRAGDFSAMVGYPGMLIASLDAGIEGVSSVLAYNDMGWCELYRGTLGERIQAMYVQSIPGNAVDRLWISEGNNIVWIPLSIDPFNHPADTYNPYEFCSEGSLITSWYYAGLQAINKLFNSLRLVIEEASASLPYVTASYQVDGDSDWTAITGTFDTFSEELDLASTPSVSGKRIRFKLTLYASSDGLSTPRVVASVMDCITRLPNKYITTVTCRLSVSAKDDYATSLTLFNALSGFQDLATPVTIESVVDMLDGRTAFVDGLTPRPLQMHSGGARPSYVVQFNLVEI